MWEHQEGLITLLPRVVDLVRDRDITVIAGGGIVDERGYVAAMALGAQGVVLGTRFDNALHFKFLKKITREHDHRHKKTELYLLQVPCNRRKPCSSYLQEKIG